MRFQLWAMDLYHCPGTEMITPDYFSCFGASLCFDELFRNYCLPARPGYFTIKKDILYMKKLFKNDVKFVDLRIVPKLLQNIIFVAFHANPIRAHIDTPRTVHHIRQRYYWPGMFQYIKHLIKACPRCS